MKATRASRTACCATILAAVDRTPPKALPGLSTPPKWQACCEDEREREQAPDADSKVWSQIRKLSYLLP